MMDTTHGKCDKCGLEIDRNWIEEGYSEPCVVLVYFDEAQGVPIGIGEDADCPKCGASLAVTR